MIEPLDRSRRDSTLFQFTTKQLRDFIDPNHLLIRIDEQLDFGKLVAPLEDCYCPDFGRPAIHPEVMVRALLICSLYNIASFRRLCSAISENIAYRWFCFLTIDDPVFDHSSISHFIDRIGRDGFAAIFGGLNEELPRLGMLSPEMYVDSSLVKANVNSQDLSPSGMTVEDFKERAIEVNGLFMITETTVDEDGVEREEIRHFQKPDGRLPLSSVDTDARWRTSRPGKPSGLHYQETPSLTWADSSCPEGSPTPPRVSGKPCRHCLIGCPCLRYRWRRTPATTWEVFGNCWKNGTLTPTSPSIPSRKQTWSHGEGLSITATTWSALKARSCVVGRSTVGTAPTSISHAKRTARRALSKTAACHRDKSAATSALRCITPFT